MIQRHNENASGCRLCLKICLRGCVNSKERILSRKERIPTRKERILSRKERIPSRKERILSRKERIPSRKERIPTRKERIPSRKERIPTRKERIPSNHNYVGMPLVGIRICKMIQKIGHPQGAPLQSK